MSGDARSVCQFRRQRPTKSDVPPAEFPVSGDEPQDAHSAYIRGDVELVRIRDAEGRIAAEGALPYPPGVLCVVPGEVWGGAVQRYFLALEEGVNLLPGFSPELQGVYSETDADGVKRLYGYVLK